MDILQGRPILYCLYFNGIHPYHVLRNDVIEEMDLWHEELTLLCIDDQLVLSKLSKNNCQIQVMLLLILRVHNDII